MSPVRSVDGSVNPGPAGPPGPAMEPGSVMALVQADRRVALQKAYGDQGGRMLVSDPLDVGEAQPTPLLSALDGYNAERAGRIPGPVQGMLEGSASHAVLEAERTRAIARERARLAEAAGLRRGTVNTTDSIRKQPVQRCKLCKAENGVLDQYGHCAFGCKR